MHFCWGRDGVRAEGYELVGEAHMGSGTVAALTAQTAVYVPTGSKLPPEADAVLKVEGSRVSEGILYVENRS